MVEDNHYEMSRKTLGLEVMGSECQVEAVLLNAQEYS